MIRIIHIEPHNTTGLSLISRIQRRTMAAKSAKPKGVEDAAVVSVQPKSTRRTDRLYADARRLQLKLKEKRRQRELEEAPQHRRTRCTERSVKLYEDAERRRLRLEQLKARLTEMREEAKRLEREPPKVEPRKRDPDCRLSSKRTEALYATHRKTQAKIAEMRKVYSTEGCTFAPDITRKAKRSVSVEARYERLYRTASLTKAKKVALVEQYEPKCSFQPKINARSSRKGKSGDRFIRLYKMSITMKKKLQVKREMLVKQSCTFHPKINQDRRKRGSSASKRDVKKGIARFSPSREELRQKKVERHQCKIELEVKDCTFKPRRWAKKIKHRGSVGVIGLFGNIYERSQAILLVWDKRRKERRCFLEAEAFKECTFQPRTNHTPTQFTTTDVLNACKRLFAGAEQRRLLYAQIRKQFTFQETNGFMPVLHINPNYQYENDPERFEKLYECGKLRVSEHLRREKDPDRLHSLVARQEEEDLRECTFTPELDPASIAMDSLTEASQSGTRRFKRLYHYAGVLQQRLDSSVQRAETAAKAMTNTRFSSENGTYEAAVGHTKSVDFEHILKLHKDHDMNLHRLEQRKKIKAHNILQAASTIFSASSVASMDLESVDFGDAESLCASSVASRTSAANMNHIKRLYNNAAEIESKKEAKRMDIEEARRDKLSTVFSAETIVDHDKKRVNADELRPKFDRTRMREYAQTQNKRNMKDQKLGSVALPFDTIWEDSSPQEVKGLLDVVEEQEQKKDKKSRVGLKLEVEKDTETIESKSDSE